jgi:hypothetical protein
MVDSSEPPASKPAGVSSAGGSSMGPSTGLPRPSSPPASSSGPAQGSPAPTPTPEPSQGRFLNRPGWRRTWKVVLWVVTSVGVSGLVTLLVFVGKTLQRIDHLSTRLDTFGQWVDCQEKEKATGKPHRFLWNNPECVEDLTRAAPAAPSSSGATQPPTPSSPP